MYMSVNTVDILRVSYIGGTSSNLVVLNILGGAQVKIVVKLRGQLDLPRECPAFLNLQPSEQIPY